MPFVDMAPEKGLFVDSQCEVQVFTVGGRLAECV